MCCPRSVFILNILLPFPDLRTAAPAYGSDLVTPWPFFLLEIGILSSVVATLASLRTNIEWLLEVRSGELEKS